MLQALANTFDSSSRDHSSFQGTPAYKPAHLSHVTAIAPDGTASLFLVVYLPESYGPASDAVSACVQAKIGRGQWQMMERSALEGNGTADTQAEKDFWTLQVEGVPPGTAVTFRYIDHQGTWRPLQPLNDLETVRGTSYVPNLAYQWKYKSPEFDHAKVLMETTLEGLLAGYKGGLFAPRSLEEMFQISTAKRILKTDIPGRIAEWSVDEIMVPVSSSVADRSQLDPKFNYLTYNGVGLDWQIGTARDFMQLLDTFHQYNIRVVPDLIFAHQVKEPFKGSIDQVRRANGEKLVVDIHAFLFRDYGTWMFKLSDPNVRRLLIENIVAFIAKFRLSMFRIDYIDGLILQYSNRDRNHAETFVAELKEELRRAVPETVALGETFEVASNPFVSDFIDVFYAPVGFTIVEELYKPPSKMARPLYPDVQHLAMELSREARSQRRDAVYAQLHDETWYCQHIVTGRPYVPWAYGGNPAELARRQGQELIKMGLLKLENLLDYVHRIVRNAEALTMFIAKLRYMFVPSVDSLCLGCLDDSDHWKVIWEGVLPQHMAFWKSTGLSERQIFQIHNQHRAEMIDLRSIFRRHTKVDPETLQSQVQSHVCHVDPDASLLGIFRQAPDPNDCLLILFNFGSQVFRSEMSYELPVPSGYEGQWQVLVDGDWIDPKQRLPGDPEFGYSPGAIVETTAGHFSNQAHVLRLSIGIISLVVLKYCPAL